jgi:zinc and cadmium transporter
MQIYCIMTFFYILLSTMSISALSLLGILAIPWHNKKWHGILLSCVALAAGTMMGGAFFHLLPESIEKLGTDIPFLLAVSSFSVFFALERFLFWRHCHDEECDVHGFGFMNLVGDGLHNFIDGLLIAAAFSVDTSLGLATALALALHEVPQEIGDFAVLLHAGLSKKIAAIANLGVALTSVLGGVVGFFLAEQSERMAPYLLPIAAGGFLYVAAADLMPQIRKEKNIYKAVTSFTFFLIGLTIMLLIGE